MAHEDDGDWRTVLLAGGAFVLPNAVAFIIVSGVLNYAVLTLELGQGSVLGVILAACLGPLLCLPYFAHLSDRYGRPQLFVIGAIGVAIWAWPMFALIDTSNLWVMFLALVVCFTGHSMMFGPQVALYSGSVAGYITVLAVLSITSIVLLRQQATDGAEKMA